MSGVGKVLLCLLLPALARCGECRSEAPKAVAADPADRPSSLRPPDRDPGPPRSETRAQVTAARQEAERLVAGMLQGGVARREVCSMADIRGYRLFRRRYFKQARVWFEKAVQTDASVEPALYDAARAAAAAGDAAAARAHLQALRQLGTPLAQSRLRLAKRDPDLARLIGRRATDESPRR